MMIIKKEDTVIPAQEVAGTYNGTLSLSVSGNDQGTSDSQVKITAEGKEELFKFF